MNEICIGFLWSTTNDSNQWFNLEEAIKKKKISKVKQVYSIYHIYQKFTFQNMRSSKWMDMIAHK